MELWWLFLFLLSFICFSFVIIYRQKIFESNKVPWIRICDINPMFMIKIESNKINIKIWKPWVSFHGESKIKHPLYHCMSKRRQPLTIIVITVMVIINIYVVAPEWSVPLLERQTRNDLVNESVTDKVGALRSIPTHNHRI